MIPHFEDNSTPMLVNGYVLFALPADRKFQPDWSRTWQTEITPAVTAAESRSSPRAQPLERLAFLITPKNLAEQEQLTECALAARKSGMACAPYHGRSSQLTAAANESTSVEVNNHFMWAAGDYIFLSHASGIIEVRQLTAVNLVDDTWTLEFATALTENYDAGKLIWPLLFGEFSCEDMTAKAPATGPLQVAIAEMTSARSAQVGTEEPPSGEGIGAWAAGTQFEVQ